MAQSLTSFELEKIEKLRQALGEKLLAETPIFNDDLSLHRWLVGWDYKFEEIVPRFANASKTLECLSLKDIIIEDIDELNLYLSAVTDASKYYSSSVLGFDDDGNVIFVNNIGSLDCKNLNKSTPNSDLYINCITEAALTYQLIKCQEQKLGKKCGVRGIIDLDGFGLDHFNNFASKVTRNLIKQLLSMFVDTSLQMFIINAHPMATAALKLIMQVAETNTGQTYNAWI
uniref:CRAL-TRIO domain-containing protein n=1 Tax=Ditylenchus dipsaci TaxID=166011 RepID=A0A915DBS5_9BILA